MGGWGGTEGTILVSFGQLGREFWGWGNGVCLVSTSGCLIEQCRLYYSLRVTVFWMLLMLFSLPIFRKFRHIASVILPYGHVGCETTQQPKLDRASLVGLQKRDCQILTQVVMRLTHVGVGQVTPRGERRQRNADCYNPPQSPLQTPPRSFRT